MVAAFGSHTTNYQFGATLVLDTPANTQDGDLLLFWVSSRSNRTVTGTPSGLTLVAGPDTTGICRVWLWSRIADSEPSSRTWTFDANQHQLGLAVRVTGADTDTPINAGGVSNGAASPAEEIVIDSITPTVEGSLLIALYAARADTDPGPLTWSHPGGMTAIGQITGDFVTTNAGSWEADLPANQSTGTRTAGYPTAAGFRGVLLAVSPAASDPEGSGSISGVGSLTGAGETDFTDPTNLDVVIDGSTAQLTWDEAATPGVADYWVFRRTPQTGEPFDPDTDIPIATGVTLLEYNDTELDEGSYDWQVFGRVPG